MLRFIHNTRKKDAKLTGDLSTHELKSALHAVLRMIQKDAFPVEMQQLKADEALKTNNKILPLAPYFDTKTGLIRVGGRLTQSALPELFKYPFLLPQKGDFKTLLVRQAHEETLHGGASLTLAKLRQMF